MNTADSWLRLLQYDAWANREALESIRNTRLHRSRKLLAHILATQWLWMQRLQGEPGDLVLWPEWSMEECAEQLGALSTAWREHLPGLIGRSAIVTVTTRGREWQGSLEDIVTHVLLHSSYHRGQMALDQRSSGQAPPCTDFVDCLRVGILD